ncbi:MAG: hypothetical protein ACE37I_20075 [Rubinisphaera brasiliensis]|uniref:hypothetical protein n=1 Tax=Rubinisphaera brasiliensis TaxID=119 RepID=UPI00391BB4E6
MPTIICTGKDNVEREFAYTSEMNNLDGTYDVMVQPVPSTSGPSFELRLKPEDGQWRIDSVTHHGLEVYKEKGIIYALIPALAAELDADIVSSPRKKADDTGTFRTKSADSYWKRLKHQGQASYDEGKDVYTFLKPVNQAAPAEAKKEESPAEKNDNQQ